VSEHFRPHIDGYVRVSRVGGRSGERFISPDVQREQITAWADGRGAALTRVFEELDESGSRADRPLLSEAISRIEAGITDGLVVSKVTRFGRSLIDGLVLIERVRAAGGRFYSVVDGLDTGTDAGRLVLRIMLSMAEWDLDRIRADWATARERAVRRGVYAGAYVPVGYRKTRSGRLKPDPHAAPIVSEAFRRRASGESVPSLCRYLESQGALTGRGNPGWTPTTLYTVFERRVYLGELTYLDVVNDHAHDPLIDPGTWQRAQRPRQLTPRSAANPVLLGGFVRCATCSMTLTVARRVNRGEPYLMYHCRKYFSRGICAAPAYVNGEALDEYVVEVLFGLLRRRRRPPMVELARAEDRVAEAVSNLARYRDNDRLRAVLGERQFAEGVRVRAQRARDARIALSNAQGRTQPHALPSVRDLRRRWGTLDVVEQRQILARVVDCVFVAKGRGNLTQRVTVCPLGTAPAGLPRQGDKGTPLRSIAPRRRWINPQRSEAARTC
jgi:site-specific DNA recombinase